jgi:hypothetical protein
LLQPSELRRTALTDVAAAISSGRVIRVEDSQDSGTLTVYYKDGTEQTARRDKSASFLEQMSYLGVTMPSSKS